MTGNAPKKKERFVTFNEHCEVSIFPYLIPAIVTFIKSAGPSTISNVPETEPFDTRSAPLIAYVLKQMGPVIHDALLHVYKSRKELPKDVTPSDTFADYLIENCKDESINADGTPNAVLAVAEHMLRASTRAGAITRLPPLNKRPGSKGKPAIHPPSKSFKQVKAEEPSLAEAIKARQAASRRQYMSVAPTPTPTYGGNDAISADLHGDEREEVIRTAKKLPGRKTRCMVSVIRECLPLGLNFVLFDPVHSWQCERFLTEPEVHSMMPPEQRWRVSMQYAAKALLGRIYVSRKVRRLSIGFSTFDDAAALTVIRQIGKQLGGKTVTVEVLRRQQPEGPEDLHFHVYDPATCTTSTTVCSGTPDFSFTERVGAVDCLLKMVRFHPATKSAALLLYMQAMVLGGSAAYVTFCLEGDGLLLQVYNPDTPDDEEAVVSRLVVPWKTARKYGLDPSVAFDCFLQSNRAGNSDGKNKSSGNGDDITGKSPDDSALSTLAKAIKIVPSRTKGRAPLLQLREPPADVALELPKVENGEGKGRKGGKGTPGKGAKVKGGRANSSPKPIPMNANESVSAIRKRRDQFWKRRMNSRFREKRHRLQPEELVWSGGVRIHGDFSEIRCSERGRMYFVSIYVGPAILNGTVRFEVFALSTGHSASLTSRNHDTRLFKHGVKLGAALQARAVDMASRLRLTRDPVGELKLELMEHESFQTKLRRSFNLMTRDSRGRIQVEQLRSSLCELQFRIPDFLRSLGITETKQEACYDFLESQIEQLDKCPKPQLDWEAFQKVLTVDHSDPATQKVTIEGLTDGERYFKAKRPQRTHLLLQPDGTFGHAFGIKGVRHTLAYLRGEKSHGPVVTTGTYTMTDATHCELRPASHSTNEETLPSFIVELTENGRVRLPLGADGSWMDPNYEE